jgi:uncharacterized membrane protein (UPF0127 family)
VKNANPVSFLWRLVVVLAVVPLTAGCGRGDAVSAAVAGEVKPATEFFEIAVGGKTVRMQLAVKPKEMERGLMERRDLGSDDGMIFVYVGTQQMSFWMRNTPTPLDIGFFTADGVLREVYPLYPYDETPVQSVGDQMKFALEVNQGWFAKNGVKPGAKLDLKALSAALKARGFEPWEYGVR